MVPRIAARDRAPFVVRLRGEGGTTLTLQVRSGPPRGEQRLTIRLVAVECDATFEDLPLGAGDLAELADYFFELVDHDAPEVTVPALSLHRPGLVFDAVTPQESEVALQLVNVSLDDGFSFDTTRLALRHAAVQLRGEADETPVRSWLDHEDDCDYTSLLWQLARLPGDSRLNGVALTHPAPPPTPGDTARVVILALHPDCDPRLELELVRVRSTGVLATLLGTLPSGDQFGIVVQQPHPAPSELAARQPGTSPPPDGLAEAAFAPVIADYHLTLADLLRHWQDAYPGTELPAAPPLRQVLLGLVGEAVGVPLPAMIADPECCLPGWDHDCQHDAVQDALGAWLDGVVGPERFQDFTITQAMQPSRQQRAPDQDPELLAREGIWSPFRLLHPDDAHVVGFETPVPPPPPGPMETRVRRLLPAPEETPSDIDTILTWITVADRQRDPGRRRKRLLLALGCVRASLREGPPKGYREWLVSVETILRDELGGG